MTEKFRPSLHDVHACEQLMHSLNEVNSDVWQLWVGHIEEMVNLFELPDKSCDECETPMPFFDYYSKQGMCDKCADKYSKDVVED